MESRTYLCTSCHITFEDGQQQRTHMKKPWHVYNIKRRIASLPPITHEAYQALNSEDGNDRDLYEHSGRGHSTSNLNTSDEGGLDREEPETPSPFQCLFCSDRFDDHDDRLTLNLEHMETAHGMTIPAPESVVDLESFLGYLATEVRSWHECLYCGATKPSTRSIQSHMRDKGHCHLNLDREPELLDFWDGDDPRRTEEGSDDATSSPEGSSVRLSATEMRLASGAVVTSRHAETSNSRQSRSHRASKSTVLALPDGSVEDPDDEGFSPAEDNPRHTSTRQLARREEMGIIGVSTQQRRALALAEKKAQRSEDVARRAREWAYAKSANTQKYDQVDTKMKMGKQNHKLQPR